MVIGVSGSGKTVVGRRVAAELGWTFEDADDLHPAANVEKMRGGVALTDADRNPWLDAVLAWTKERGEAGESTVTACSALRRAYRERLAMPGAWFVLLHVDGDEVRRRVARRHEQEGHFMPASLVESQLATLEPLALDEPGTTVDAGRPLDDVVAAVADVVSTVASGVAADDVADGARSAGGSGG